MSLGEVLAVHEESVESIADITDNNRHTGPDTHRRTSVFALLSFDRCPSFEC